MQFGREWTKFAVRFRELSGLESVRLERVDCILLRLLMQGFRWKNTACTAASTKGLTLVFVVNVSFSLSAEAAHLVMRNVNYEIPALKRQIGRCQQAQRVSFSVDSGPHPSMSICTIFIAVNGTINSKSTFLP